MAPELRQRTRQWFADNALACIAEVESGAVVLPAHTSLAAYREHHEARAAAAMAGEYDRSLTFHQRADWIAGKPCKPLLP